MRSLWRRVTVVIAVLCAAVGITSAAATAAPQTNASPMALIKLTFTNLNNGNLLDVQNGSRNDKTPLVTNPAPGFATTWRINTGANPGAGFAIVNDTIGKCVDADRNLYALRLQPCDGRATEQWYFQPVSGSGQKAFMIRHVTDNACFTAQVPPGTDNGAYSNTCDGTPYQQWTLPAEAYKTAWNTAVDYAAARCGKDTSTCSWTTANQTTPFAMPEACVSPVWFNDTSQTIPWTFSLTTETGWTNTIGFILSGSFSAGGNAGVVNLQLMVTAEIHGSTTLDLKQTLGNSLQVSVPPRQYGWVTLSELATKVTGTWTFDTQGFPWTADDTITVPLKSDSTGGASIYSARTRPTFTNCAGTT
ncbi:ricin-type beta-trefoil lectin domain protein [Amycolatopsis sp. NPDC059027]|uniref:ricin-type beta-trefoil lectin domain protein n=1 Tax=Amycolatopsis sp. NPDC059027 TaxID=3346709 RepID=UPI0036700152